MIQPFPEGPGRWQVSANGGVHPRWRPDGKEIYFINGRVLMAAPVTMQPAFTVGTALPLFTLAEYTAGALSAYRYEPLPDGRFALLEPAAGRPAAIHLVHDWLRAVERK